MCGVKQQPVTVINTHGSQNFLTMEWNSYIRLVKALSKEQVEEIWQCLLCLVNGGKYNAVIIDEDVVNKFNGEKIKLYEIEMTFCCRFIKNARGDVIFKITIFKK